MSDTIYTQQRTARFRGPTTSDDYNARIEELYKDLVYLYNKSGLVDEDLSLAYRRLIKDHFSLGLILVSLEERIATLEAAQNKLVFTTANQIDNANFIGTPYEISAVDQCSFDIIHNVMTLPKLESGSVSQLKFVGSDETFVVPSSFETIVDGVETTADNSNSIIDTSDPYFAVVNKTGKVWERNIVVNTPNINGAEANLYVRLPSDLSVVADSNAIVLHPYPMMGVDIVDVSYSTLFDVTLSEGDNYYPLNEAMIYSGQQDAIGWLPPGAWSGDEIEKAGPKIFYFDPKPITAIRIRLRQKEYFSEVGKAVYTYGLSKLDVRYDKFLDTGKCLLRFDAPTGHLISSINNVTPQIWNVSEAELDDIFSYRVIWETSENSGQYITSSPGGLASKIWIEVTLKKTLNNGTPSLSGLLIDYS